MSLYMVLLSPFNDALEVFASMHDIPGRLYNPILIIPLPDIGGNVRVAHERLPKSVKTVTRVRRFEKD